MPYYSEVSLSLELTVALLMRGVACGSRHCIEHGFTDLIAGSR